MSDSSKVWEEVQHGEFDRRLHIDTVVIQYRWSFVVLHVIARQRVQLRQVVVSNSPKN